MSSTPESTPPSPGCPNVFSIRIVSLDYYMAVPIPGLDFCDSPCFQGRRVEEVPVIRIYGSTLAGQKACLHVHRALPYLYIPCSELEMSKEGQIYINEVSDAVERALQGTYGLKRQHVHGCCLVRAKKFYGYHSAEELFVKIYLYHPTDVARAATLLLGGSVLSRSIQPYESHIPFLLQFMVDCNLYGMSHLHTSQIKFRHPLPDKLIPRAAPNTMHRDFVLEKASSVSASFQAGSCGEAIGNAALWLSSTVPDAWTWTTSDQDILNDKSCVKRQTICELEGDSSIDGILNQSAKIYSSFSQTSHDLKMVQSLIPIWEEELERSGLQEYISSPDISKPPPETVLRSLCDGFQYENGLSDVFTEAKKKLSFKDSLLDGGMMLEQHMKSSADTGGPLILTEDQKLNPLGEEHVHFSEVVSARSSLLESNATPERICEFPGSSSYVGKLNSLTVIRETEKKVSDVETLGLLSWLTSSQAVDGFGSDDELIHETILSPQLLSNSYEKALEKAHLEYETASQQECQDILDSLKGFQFEDQNEASASTGDQDFVVNDPLKVIPQVDGSSDDQNIFPQVDKPSNGDPKRKMETEMTTSSITEKHVSCWPGRKNKRNYLSWGPQPFSTEQKRPTVSCSSNDVSELLHPDERKSSDDARSLSLIDADERCESSDTETEHKLAFMEEERQPIDSVKDELRSNHCNRIDRFEHGKHLLKELTAEIQCNKINRTEEQESKPPGNIKDSMIPSEISHEESCFPKKHRTFVCRESMTFNIACTDSPSDVVQPAELHSSANFYLQDNAPNEDLDPNKSLITRECLDASIGPLEVVDGNVLQMNDASNQVPGLFDTRQLPPAMFNLLSKCSGGGHSSRPGSSGNGVSRIVSFQPDLSEGLSHLKCGSTGNMCAENSQKGMQAKDSNRSRTFALEATSFPVNYNSSTEEYSATEKSLSDVHLKNLGTVKAVSYLKTLEGNEGGCETSGIRACNPRTALVMEDAPVGFVEMTLNRRPPIILKTKDVSEDSEPSTDFIRNIDSTGLPHCETHQFIGFQPFFSDADIEKGVHKYAIGGSYSETIGSIPTNFQNDGSLSYLLTFAICPPSPQSVYQWLLRQTKKNGLCLSMDLSSASDDCPGNVSEYWHGCHHDIPTSMSPEVLDASVCPDSDGFSEKYSDSLKSVANDSQNLNAHSISGNVDVKLENVLDSGAEMSNKSQVEAINMQSKLSAGGYCDISQISGVNEKAKLTPLSQIGFRDPASGGSGQNLTLLSLEIQAESRGSLLPDPQFDAINLISIAIQEDTDYDPKFYVLVRGTDVKSYGRNVDGISGCVLLVFSEERLLFDHLVKVIISYDPDILLGWDVQGSSLGYLAERAAHLGMHLLKSISRTLDIDTKHMAKRSVNHDKEVVDKLASEAGMESIVVDAEIIEDEWGRTHASGIHVGGRIVLNVWRLMRSELKLNLYTVEAVAEEVLRRKVPSIPCTTLNSWFSSGRQRARFRCIEYVLERANLNLQIMNQLDMVNRTSELARVFGIDFFSVLSRGSQFRVESMLLRLLHSQNYLAISPGYQQVASQPAMECLPLVMEPESGFYADPVVVLDFQSLYPSMIIAYNLCYSTCLGKVLPSAGNILGVSSFSPDSRLLLDLKENTLLSPNGVMYVASKVRKGVLPRMLEEILSTRIMVKKAMKKLMPSQQVLQRIMNARQLALKLIANVTYGYTAAGFSGRMPCAELADSIVQCGRKTLEKSISFINSHSKWNARVVYGDTDSMFVLLRGRSREEAFEIGREIALTITSMNPKPVVLKMEKVYHPCFLLTKKRYVGYSYESQGQVKPSFDAKGIETVRRDTCPAVAKTFERSLRLFFERQDVTQVKLYLQRQWARILSGRVSLQDFIFAKEVRLGTYSSAAAASLPPAAIVAAKAMKADPRREPRYGERVPYVVVHGEPGARLVDMVVDPLELLEVNSLYRLNDSYYINKQIIPVLQRAFGLVGADLRRWFLETPRPLRPTAAKRLPLGSSSSASVKPPLRNRIDRYYLSKNCAVCGNLVQRSTFLCDGCSARGPSTAAILIGKTSKLERDLHHLSDICRHCGGGDWIIESGVKCTSLACPVFFERRKVQKELLSLSAVSAEAGFYPKCVSEWF